MPPRPEKPCSDSNATRASLLARLGQGSGEQAWRAVVDLYWRLVYSRGRDAGLTHEEATDASQETFINLVHLMPRFEYDQKKGSFRGLVCRIAHCRVVDQLRKRPPQAQHPDGTNGAETLESSSLPFTEEFSAQWDRDWQERLKDLALNQIRSESNPRHYQAFDLCVIQGRPVSEVAETLNVSAGFIYLSKHRILRQLKKAVRELESRLG